jgi:hypothetical protein
MAKINNCGVFLPFEGYTVISFLKNRNDIFWSDFHHFLDHLPVFNKYYKTLPVTSFHMTVKNHICVADKDYKSKSLSKTNFSQISEICKIMDVTPKARATNMYTESSLGLMLNPSDENGNLDKLRSIMVAMGMKPEPNFKFHMTFAYRFKIVDPQDLDAIKKEFQEIYNKLTRVVSLGLEFEEARFCYFFNMKEYISYS